MEYNEGRERDVEIGYKLLLRSVNNMKYLLSEYKYWSLLVSDGLIDYSMTNEEDDEEYLEMVREYEEYNISHNGVVFKNK